MELVAVLRLLWRRRIVVVAGFVASLAIGVTLGKSPTPPSGIAQTRVVVDTQSSQLLTGNPMGADSLPWRATLLGMLMPTDASRRRIAAEMHIPLSQLAVTDLELTLASVPASLPAAALKASSATTEPYVVDVHTDGVVPIISIDTTAPDRAGAARLAQAAVHAVEFGAPAQTTAELQGLRVEQVSPVEAKQLPGGPGRMKMAMLAVVVFCMWLAFVVFGPGARRHRSPQKIALGTAVD
jgi:hypothetical protein